MKTKLPYFAFLLSIVLVTFLWESIKLPFDINTAIFGDSYLENQHHPQNDTIRFITFLSIPFLILICLLQFYEKVFLNNTKKVILSYDLVNLEYDKKLNFFFYTTICFIILEFFFLNFKDFNFHIDLFHEGQGLTASYNAKITSEFWQSSYIVRGFFGNFYPYLLWSLLDFESVGITRFFNFFVILLNKILLLFIAFKIAILTDFKSTKKIIFYFLLSITLLTFTSYHSPIFFLRSFLLLFFILIIINFISSEKNRLININIIGLLSSVSMFWYLDIGIYINLTIFLIFVFFIVKKELKYLLNLFFSLSLGWIILFFLIPENEFNEFLKNTKSILLTIDYIHGLIFPTPFISQDSRSIKALLLFLITGFFIITAINKAENYNLKFLLVISMLFMISIIYFKYGLSRSDSGHIRGATGFLYIPFFSFLFLKLIKLFPNKKINISKKINLIFNSLLIIIFFSTILINKKFERKSISNFISSKENILKLFRYSDESYISEDYQKLVSYYNDLSKSDSCAMIFTHESAIPYFLKKNTCSKYFFMYTATPKEIQSNIMKDLNNNKPVFLIYKSDIDAYGHAGDRLKILNKYILDKYSFYEKFKHWEIYKLK